MLALLSGAELLGMSLWFTASAVSPQLAELWGLTSSQTGALTTLVQIGFVAGTAVAAALNLADILPERPYFAASAALGALANAAIAIAPGYEAALVLRFLTGFFLAGVFFLALLAGFLFAAAFLGFFFGAGFFFARLGLGGLRWVLAALPSLERGHFLATWASTLSPNSFQSPGISLKWKPT